MKKISFMAAGLLLLSQTAFAISGIGISRDFNGIDGMAGFSLNGQFDWASWQVSQNWELAALGTAGLTYYQTSRSKDSRYSNLTLLSLTPTLRFQRSVPFDNSMMPFFDAGYGAGLMNRNQFSEQKLGGYFTFAQTLGVGIIFGEQAQFSVSYHYSIYNNASVLSHDDGLYVNSIDFMYFFGEGKSK